MTSINSIKKLSLSIFFLFMISFVFSKEIVIFFVCSGFDNYSQKLETFQKYKKELIEFFPLSYYSKYLDFSLIDDNKLENLVKITKYNHFDIKKDEFIKEKSQFDNKLYLIIFIIKSQISKGQGGTIEGVNVILASSNSKSGVISHEFCHSIFKLGDEYSGSIPFPPSQKEISQYKNLSLQKYNSDWEYVKKETKNDLIGYYPGGLERSEGVYHSYPNCLMKNLNKRLCPVCVYYAVNILNQITLENLNLLDILKDNQTTIDF